MGQAAAWPGARHIDLGAEGRGRSRLFGVHRGIGIAVTVLGTPAFVLRVGQVGYPAPECQPLGMGFRRRAGNVARFGVDLSLTWRL
jgi:hypothetical protein